MRGLQRLASALHRQRGEDGGEEEAGVRIGRRAVARDDEAPAEARARRVEAVDQRRLRLLTAMNVRPVAKRKAVVGSGTAVKFIVRPVCSQYSSGFIS